MSTKLLRANHKDNRIEEDEDHTGVHPNGRLIIDLSGGDEGTDDLETTHNYNSDDDFMDCRSIISISESEESNGSFEQEVEKRVLTDTENTADKRSKNNGSSKDVNPDLPAEGSAVAVEKNNDKQPLEEGKVNSTLRNAINRDKNGSQNLDKLDDNESCSALIHDSDFDESSDEDNVIGSGSENEESDEEADDFDEETDDDMENEDGQIAVDEETSDEDEGSNEDEEVDEDEGIDEVEGVEEDEGIDQEGEVEGDDEDENSIEMAADESDETLGEKNGPSASDRRSSRPPRPSKLALQAIGDSQPHKSAPSR
jgi:hypothetical protein